MPTHFTHSAPSGRPPLPPPDSRSAHPARRRLEELKRPARRTARTPIRVTARRSSLVLWGGTRRPSPRAHFARPSLPQDPTRSQPFVALGTEHPTLSRALRLPELHSAFSTLSRRTPAAPLSAPKRQSPPRNSANDGVDDDLAAESRPEPFQSCPLPPPSRIEEPRVHDASIARGNSVHRIEIRVRVALRLW
jgi:hypothetical protein